EAATAATSPPIPGTNGTGTRSSSGPSKQPTDGDGYKVVWIGSEFRFQCVECDQCFSTTQSMTNHRMSHNGGQPYRCQVDPNCHYETARLSVLRRHEMQVHFKDQKVYRCSKITCAQTFLNFQDLHQHILMHKTEPKFVCF